MPGKQIRIFIAISLPSEVRIALEQTSRELAEQMPPRSVRWVKPDLMHVTLRFLGDTAVSLLPQLTAGLDQIAAQHSRFELTVSGLGCFPNRKRPRVIWAGLRGDMAPVNGLVAELNALLVPLGWKPEKRPFRPHLTLGRVKDSRKLQEINWGVNVEEMVVGVTAVHLIESLLRSSGPIYTVRHSSQLAE